MENDKIFSIMNDLIELRTEMDKNDIGSITENDMLYTLSFISLIRNGLDFSVISKVVGEKEEKKSFISFGSSSKEKELVTKEYVEIKAMMGDFSCSTDNIKKYLSEQEYNKLILKLSDKSSVPPKLFKISEYDETLGVVSETGGSEIVSDIPTDNPDDDMFNKNSTRIPHFYEDRKLDSDIPGKKYLSSMLYHTHILDITINNTKLKAIFAVYPVRVTVDDPATDIAVAAALYDPVTKGYSAPRGGVSRGASSSVNIEFDEFVFVIHGAWERGLFKSYVRSVKKGLTINDEKLIEHMPEKNDRTSTGFAVTKEIEGLNIYIFPAVIGENTAKGYIIGAIAIENTNERSLSVLTPNSNGEFTISNNNTEYVLGAYWQGSTPKDCVLVYNIEG